MELNSPISPIPSIETASKGKQTPSTSTRKKPETTICLEDEEYTFSPNSDSVFDLSDVNLDSPGINLHISVKPPDAKCSAAVKAQKPSVSSIGGSAVCRICHGGEFSSPVKGEPLISVCYCRGTMGLFHRSCLEMWLSASNRDQCEICKFQYVTERIPRPFPEFLKNPGSVAAKRNLIGDFVCWCILTPLTTASAWLCVTGAVHYADQSRDTVEVPGLICLAVFLVITYGVWLTVSLRYHFKVWQDWRCRNQKVRVVDMKEIMRRVHSNSFGTRAEVANKDRRRIIASRRSAESDNSLPFVPPWNASLQVFRTNMIAANAEPSPTSTSLNIRFTYPMSSIGLYETAV
jgi:hypothetical protein